jgi:methyl-accepting chemotaxis protein
MKSFYKWFYKWFYDMKITAKISSSFILVGVIVVMVGFMGITSLKSMSKSDTVLFENVTVPLAQIGDISTAFQRMRVNSLVMITANDAETIKDNVDKINELQAEIDSLANEFEERIVSDEMKVTFREFTDARSVYEKQLESIISLATENRDAEALALMAETSPAEMAFRAEQDAITKIGAMKVDDAKAQEKVNRDSANHVITTMTLVMIGSTVYVVALGVFLSVVISRPLKKATHMIKEIRIGHLSERLNIDTRDEIGEMATAMDQMADDLQNIVIGTMKQISEGMFRPILKSAMKRMKFRLP